MSSRSITTLSTFNGTVSRYKDASGWINNTDEDDQDDDDDDDVNDEQLLEKVAA